MDDIKTDFAEDLDRDLTTIMKWFGLTIAILGLLIIIIALIRALYVHDKRKKLLVEGELSNYLKFESEGERGSELATNSSSST